MNLGTNTTDQMIQSIFYIFLSINEDNYTVNMQTKKKKIQEVTDNVQ